MHIIMTRSVLTDRNEFNYTFYTKGNINVKHGYDWLTRREFMRHVSFVVAVIVLFLSFAVASSAQDTKPETHIVKRVVATVGSDGVQRVAITGGEYFFDPNYIVVKANVPVELDVIKTSGFIPHDIVVKAPEAGIDFKVELNDKKPEIIKFTPTKVGKYAFYCDKKVLWFESHREKGMEGVIEVVP